MNVLGEDQREVCDRFVDPHAVQPRVPLWIGGRTLRSLRRAVSSGDGWVPFGLGGDEPVGLLARVDLPPSSDVVLSAGRPLDPIGAPDAARRALARAASLGATIAGASLTRDIGGALLRPARRAARAAQVFTSR